MEIKPYSGWRPRSMRNGKASSDKDKRAKRNRLGPRKDQQIYVHAKGYKNPEYGRICEKADRLQRGG